MEFHMKLPRNKFEVAIFMAIVSILSVNVIAPLITFFECGFRVSVWLQALKIIPLIWISVIILVLASWKPAEWLTFKLIRKEDSFQAFVLANILSSVFLLSIFLTIIGTWIGSRRISLDPIVNFFYKWPRNFAISFAVEALFAQPIARFCLYRLHLRQDGELQNAS